MPTLNAYVLLADPAFIEASVLSYYDHVNRIVATYDGEGLGWGGKPIESKECIERLTAIDRDSKIEFVPGHWRRQSDEHLMSVETRQRQAGIDAASDPSAWVLQLDADEVMGNPIAFTTAIERAMSLTMDGLEYPSRWLHTRIAPNIYLERSLRFGRRWEAIPGSLAVRSGTRLRWARQADVRCMRAGYARSADYRIKPRDAVLHYAAVRTDAEMRGKVAIHGHSEDSMRPDLTEWLSIHRRPLREGLRSTLTKGRANYRVSIVRPEHDPVPDRVSSHVTQGASANG